MNIYHKLNKPFFVLAPMDDVTDVVFRSIVADCAKPDLFFTEFVNVDGLQSIGRKKLLHKLKTSKSDHPIIAQLWGKTPENYFKTAQDLSEMGFDGVDINMGCPVKAVVKNGCCVALINNRGLAKDIIDATKAGASGKIPVSVKTRLGFDEIDFSWHEFLLNRELDCLTIHGRTKKQLSATPADWSSIGRIREIRDEISPRTLIVGNGDAKSIKHSQEFINKYSLDGVMLGRAIFDDPFVFAKNSPWKEYTPRQKMDLFAKHISLFTETYQNNERNLNVLRKFCKTYINNFDGAKDLREKLMETNSSEELLAILR